MKNAILDFFDNFDEELPLDCLPTNTAPEKFDTSSLRRQAPIKLLDTINMTDEEFSSVRQNIEKALGYHVLGGSDTGKALGISRFVSAQELYDAKVGNAPEVKVNDDSKKWIFTAGHAFEEGVAKLTKLYWEQKGYSVKIDNDTGMYQCGTRDKNGELRYPFAVGNLDRVITVNGKKGVLEIKTTSFNAEKITKLRNGEIYPEYLTQIRYYMAITNYDFAVISVCWGSGPQDFVSIVIHRDLDTENELMESMRDFWLLIEEGGKRKIPDGTPSLLLSYLKRYYGDVDETAPMADMDGEKDSVGKILALNEEISSLKAQIKALESQKSEIYNDWMRLFEKSGESVVILDDGRRICVKRTPGYNADILDEDKLKKEKPDIYQKFLKETFDCASFKAEYKEIYSQYLFPKTINPESKKDAFSLKVLRDKPLKKQV